ncbi:MAG: HD domain-containing protein [Bacilli bacterium]|nr:HD domain-containing protein [Bacilli bacterium]
MVLLKDLLEGDRTSIQALVGSVSNGTNKSGIPYLNVELRDNSGSLTCKKWEVDGSDKDIFVVGNIVEVMLEVIKYNDSLQGKILGAKLLPLEGIDTTRFIKAPPIPKEELIARFNKLVDSIKDKDCKALLDYFIKKFGETIYVAPAASSVHHEFSSGLLMHSVSLGEHADYFAKYYPDINRDLLVTGALLHDFGKMIELEGPAVYHYSLEGKLLGHISIMCAELRMAAKELGISGETPLLLEHMVLSHHGQLEFGSPVLPLTKEALLLSMIDNLDSKMLVLDKAFSDVGEGEFTQKVFALDGRSFYKPKK